MNTSDHLSQAPGTSGDHAPDAMRGRYHAELDRVRISRRRRRRGALVVVPVLAIVGGASVILLQPPAGPPSATPAPWGSAASLAESDPPARGSPDRVALGEAEDAPAPPVAAHVAPVARPEGSGMRIERLATRPIRDDIIVRSGRIASEWIVGAPVEGAPAVAAASDFDLIAAFHEAGDPRAIIRMNGRATLASIAPKLEPLPVN